VASSLQLHFAGWRETLSQSTDKRMNGQMQSGDLRIGKTNSWIGERVILVARVENTKYHPERIVDILLSDGRLSRDTYHYINTYTVPIEDKL